MKQPSQGSTSATRLRTLKCAAIVFCCLLNTSLSSAQKSRQDKAWQKLVSTEGRFQVLMPDTPEDRFVPVIGQIVNREMHAYFVRTPVASYVVAYADLPNVKDPRLLKKGFDDVRDGLLSNGKLRLLSEKNITLGVFPGRELVVDDGANVGTDRIYFVNGRLFQLLFLHPQLGGMPDEMMKFYDGLSSKFFDSFKTDDTSARR
ncbi:MAG TPA: hypothetical protein VGC60_11690 [Pyrinomonadaceae bacterium]